MQVFTTCSNQKKRDYLQQTFPFLDDAHIGDSRSTSFEALIKKQARHLVKHTCPSALLMKVSAPYDAYCLWLLGLENPVLPGLK